jgi:hypothetical protein
LPARLGEPQRRSALAEEALVGALRLENRFLKSARIELNPFLLFAYIYINEYTLRPGGEYGRVSQENSLFVYTPSPVAHPF